MDFRVHEKEVSRALTRSNLADPFVVAKYRASPYMACGHGCTYCDGRAERYYVEGEFDHDIVVRTNLPDLLTRELSKTREKGPVSLGSGITDAYQPLETRLRLTRRIAEQIRAAGRSATVLTKSSLPTRDLDIWADVAAASGFVLAVSLTTLDDGIRSRFEPGASSVEERLEMISLFRSHGCSVGVLAMPFIPFVTDDLPGMDALYRELAARGVDFIVPAGLTLRPGRQKDHFLGTFDRFAPERRHDIRKLYAEDRASGMAVASYRRDLDARCRTVQQRHRIAPLLPHRVFRGRLQLYDEIHVLLHHLEELYCDRTGPEELARLVRARKSYDSWLLERKAFYNRRRSLRYDELDNEVRAMLEGESFLEADRKPVALLANRRLIGLLKEVAGGKRVFDYITRRLLPSDTGEVRR